MKKIDKYNNFVLKANKLRKDTFEAFIKHGEAHLGGRAAPQRHQGERWIFSHPSVPSYPFLKSYHGPWPQTLEFPVGGS